MIKILHTGDLHLGSVAFSHNKEKDVLEKCFDNICVYAKDNNIDYVLLCGDNFERDYITSKTLKSFYGSVKKADNVKFIVIAGNHDFMGLDKNPYESIDFPENVFVFKNFQVEKMSFEDVDFYGVSYKDNAPGISPFKNFSIENKEKINIALFHGDVSSSGEYMNISKEDIRNSGLDYIAMGHIHKASGFEKEGDTYYCYCGCPQGRGFDETGVKSFAVLEFEKGMPPKFQRIRSSLFNYEILHLDISEIKTTLELEDKINKEISVFDSEDVIRIYLTGTLNEDVKLSVIKDIFKNCEITDNTVLFEENKHRFDPKSIMGTYFRILEDMKISGDIPCEIIEKAEKMGYYAFSDEEDISWL